MRGVIRLWRQIRRILLVGICAARIVRRSILSPGRAARLYQDALWIVESEPNLAWIMLVSTVETAAKEWSDKNHNRNRFIDFVVSYLPPPPRYEEYCGELDPSSLREIRDPDF
jgi:hypothetical protein